MLRICNKSEYVIRNGRGYHGACYLSDLKTAGECCGALELCAPFPSEKGAPHLVCTWRNWAVPRMQTLVFPTPNATLNTTPRDWLFGIFEIRTRGWARSRNSVRWGWPSVRLSCASEAPTQHQLKFLLQLHLFTTLILQTLIHQSSSFIHILPTKSHHTSNTPHRSFGDRLF